MNAPDKEREDAEKRSIRTRTRSSLLMPSWWAERFADLVERRRPDGTYEARPKQNHNRKTYPLPSSPSEMLPRPEGMSRQVQRLLYRKACKRSGFDYRGYGDGPRVVARRLTGRAARRAALFAYPGWVSSGPIVIDVTP